MATWVLTSILLLSAPAFAQTAPALHSRGHDDQQEAPTRAAKGVSTLPDNASGEFTLNSHGSVVQITIEHNRLTGYVTLMQQDTALTLFFDKTSIKGKRVTFTTKTVHGLSYSFAGEVVCGDSEAPALNGYYHLAGRLTTSRNGVAETKWISLKSTPRVEGKD